MNDLTILSYERFYGMIDLSFAETPQMSYLSLYHFSNPPSAPGMCISNHQFGMANLFNWKVKQIKIFLAP